QPRRPPPARRPGRDQRRRLRPERAVRRLQAVGERARERPLRVGGVFGGEGASALKVRRWWYAGARPCSLARGPSCSVADATPRMGDPRKPLARDKPRPADQHRPEPRRRALASVSSPPHWLLVGRGRGWSYHAKVFRPRRGFEGRTLLVSRARNVLRERLLRIPGQGAPTGGFTTGLSRGSIARPGVPRT